MTAHDELPLPDYDHLPLAGLIQRLRTLDADGVRALRDFESTHANRLQVTEALDERLAELAGGASPTGGSPSGLAPEAGAAPGAPRQTDQTTDAPSINPPSHGDPTNPAQPR